MKRFVILLLYAISCGCNSQPADFRLFSKGILVPEVVFVNSELKGAAENFCRFFEEATGQRLVPSVKATQVAGAIITIALNRDIEPAGHFRIIQQDNKISIEGESRDDIDSGIRYFFSHFVHVEPVSEGVKSTRQVNEIVIPSGLQYVQQYAFEYREPYFPDNFLPEFRQWNNTHTLEENWGLWGHNIGKAIKITHPMYATVDGVKNDEQLCFSSPELEDALIAFIEQKQAENPSQDKFMVMPNDNGMVCLCDKCKAAGNTKSNASPAVFTLLNSLAENFPSKEFFSTAYITTQSSPNFKLAANTSVMISTMQFPKGVVIEKSNRRAGIERTFADWRAVTKKIYLWDYAVNFDNYFDAYPTVKIAQQNLKFYKKQGVTGVFMHGSEENYSSFSSVKCYLYAQLLQDLDADIDKLTKDFYIRRYPAAADLLSSYYLSLETSALQSPRQLDIYGGIVQSEKKYLDADSFTDFYNKLTDRLKLLSQSEAVSIKPLLASFTFQRLELMRTKGLGEGGYGTLNGNTLKVTPQADILLDRLANLSSEAGIKVVNESGLTITDYIRSWRRDITPGTYRNLYYGKKLKFTGTPDEEYADISMLTDGATGFTDYYNNWLLSTASELAVEVNADEVRNLNYIEMGFLNDPRHNIYFPEKVIVTINDRKYEAVIAADGNKKPAKKSVKIPVTLLPADKTITIQTVKQQNFARKSVACDEVCFK
ncbi:DUF4838 domain-containing protein [Flavobacterium sp. J372]|uniref:DUF4838 domain-containing protein n=1 Tax=Flavobacterium sp. J372 TaxID=2898436 RepID=UPI0021519CEC|nr:DUF4838 domain-containing protein [Flavobacterium sp. J372]MCR5862423.1 DUF4838 domain-containing protein [Flavobacterium sp. J372]